MDAVPSSISLRHLPKPSDVDAVREIVSSTAFFSATEIDVAVELIEDRIRKGAQSDYRFVFADENGVAIGYSCYGPIPCTVGSFDLYWIAVRDSHRGTGMGRCLLREVEKLIASEGGRRIYVETSSRDMYEPTRQFYLRCGYHVEAMLNDFYAQGDGKVIFARAI